jgi:Undecaprenyl-phosphate galactose phosphotransferase WbaP
VPTLNALRSITSGHLADRSIQVASGSQLCLLLIFAADVLGITIALSTYFATELAGRQVARGEWVLMWGLVPVFLTLFWIFGLYPGISVSPVDEIRQACLSIGVGFLFVFVTLASRDGVTMSRLICVPACICASVLIVGARSATRRLGSRFAWWGNPVAVFGSGEVARSILSKLRDQPWLGLRPVAVVSDDYGDEDIEGISVYRLEHLSQIASAGVRHAIFAAPELSRLDFKAVLGLGCDVFPNLLVIPDTNGIWKTGCCTYELAGVLGIQHKNDLLDSTSRIAKRSMDLVFSCTLLLLLLPLLAGISLFVAVDTGLPVFYSQERLGRGGRTFRIWKFRTMVRNSAQVLDQYLASHPEEQREWALCHKLLKDPRVTTMGRFLRRTSLDELPQLWNVLRGEMSLVGPRPIVSAEVKKYQKQFTIYTKTMPGMTGLWQVSGRNHTTYDQRVALDVHYVRNWSVWLDVYLLAKTVAVVLTGHGAY